MSLVNDSTDVFVVGGGPAGLAAAIAARQKGLNVTVADGAAPPIDKTCGEGLMPETWTLLGGLGVQIEPADGFRFRGIRFIQDTASASADFSEGCGIGLARPRLHEKLAARAAACGVRLLWNSPVTGADSEGVSIRERKIRTRWLIGADGLASRISRLSAVGEPHRGVLRFANRRHFCLSPWSDYVEIHWGQRAQAYVTPVGPDEVSVVTIGERSADAEFPAALQSMPALKDRLRNAEVKGRERGAVTVSRSRTAVQRKNVALVGDASGSIDAITGEGLRLAFRQASALAEALSGGALEDYEREHRKLHRRPLLMARLMVFLGRHPSLRARVIRSLAENPGLFAKFLALHAGEATPADFVAMGAGLGWQMLAL